MPLTKKIYKFDPENIQYYKVNEGFFPRLLLVLRHMFIILIVGILLNVFFSFFFDTPVERGIRMENEKLKNEYTILRNKLTQATLVLEDLRARDNNIFRIIFDAEPINSEVYQSGLLDLSTVEGLSNKVIVNKVAHKISELNAKMKKQTATVTDILEKTHNKADFLKSLPAIQPIRNTDLTRTAAGYGWKIHPIYKIKIFHNGIDFTAPIGEEVFATGAGVVLEAAKNRPLKNGNYIVIDHGYGYKTLYAHLKDIKVRVGTKVKRGDVIGTVGSSGLSVVPHLHYEVIKDDENVNPVYYFFNELTAGQFKSIVDIAERTGQTFD